MVVELDSAAAGLRLSDVATLRELMDCFEKAGDGMYWVCYREGARVRLRTVSIRRAEELRGRGVATYLGAEAALRGFYAREVTRQ